MLYKELAFFAAMAAVANLGVFVVNLANWEGGATDVFTVVASATMFVLGSVMAIFALRQYRQRSERSNKH